jgi:four helix bundle protein
VWQDAVAFYKLNCQIFIRFPYALRRVATQAIASSDSVHRNIAEGYCRRSIKEYLNFLYIALGSLGESVSGLHAYRGSEQLSEEQFAALDALAFKLENGLLKLVESLERKKSRGEWVDKLIVEESNAMYFKNNDADAQQNIDNENERRTHHSITPPLHCSMS